MRPLALLLILLALPACTSWHAVSSDAVAAQAPSRVRVTDTAGREQTLRAPAVRRDTLVGTSDGAPSAVALADVRRLEARRLSPVKTAGAVVLTGVGAVVAYVAFIVGVFAAGSGP